MFTPLHITAPGIQSCNFRCGPESAKSNAPLAPDAGTILTEESGEAVAVLPSRATEKPAILHDVVVRYSIHEESGKTVIRIVDKKNNKIIREIPSEEDLERSARLRMHIGRLFDVTA